MTYRIPKFTVCNQMFSIFSEIDPLPQHISHVRLYSLSHGECINEPPRGKTNNVVFEQV